MSNKWFFLFFYRVLCICGNTTHLATGSLDRKINIWVLKDGTLCQTLIGHSKGIWSLKFLSSALLISGSYDATIKVCIFLFRRKSNLIFVYFRYGI
jgi:WD40 repeat protein